MNNVIAAHEILYYVKNTEELGLLLKLNFDNVDWKYILTTFKHRGS
jgi:hypothetical protein